MTGQPMARDSYGGPDTCALLGIHLFKMGPYIEGAGQVGAPLFFCTGNRRWERCARGLETAMRVLREQIHEFDNLGIRSSDIEEDWGVICNEAGEITHRAISARGIVPVRYLGRSDGPLVEVPLTIVEAGIDQVAKRPRQRG